MGRTVPPCDTGSINEAGGSWNSALKVELHSLPRLELPGPPIPPVRDAGRAERLDDVPLEARQSAELFQDKRCVRDGDSHSLLAKPWILVRTVLIPPGAELLAE